MLWNLDGEAHLGGDAEPQASRRSEGGDQLILNVSRWKSWKLCKRKAFNTYHRKLEGLRSMNLVDGGAFHKGVAVGRATKDWVRANEEALRVFDEDVAKSTIPPEQEYLIAEHQTLIQKMLQCFEEQYAHESYQILQPECEFDVALPASEHNCIFLHWVDGETGHAVWGPPPAEKILAAEVYSPHDARFAAPQWDASEMHSAAWLQRSRDCRCYVPHRFTGRTDAIVAWNQNVWLDEYKTTAIAGDQFWDQWQIDIQPTAYLYGIWRQLKIRPRGFLLNAINKPSEGQVANWNQKRKYGPQKGVVDYIRLEREGFARTEADLYRVERQLLQACYDWEREILAPVREMPDRFGMTPSSTSCKSYNRRCDYFGACMEHDATGALEALLRREPDYVDEKLTQIQGVHE